MLQDRRSVVVLVGSAGRGRKGEPACPPRRASGKIGKRVKENEIGAGIMTIYGLSQSSGVERRLHIEMGGQGVVLIISNHDGNREQVRALVPTDDLLAALTDPPPSGSRIEGVSPPNGPSMLLTVDVRRNEVLLQASAGSGEWADIAVGLDDFQDALEGVITRG